MTLSTFEKNLYSKLEGYFIQEPSYVRDETPNTVHNIYITSQEDFDSLNSAIIGVIPGDASTNHVINVIFDGGTYCFNEKHIMLTSLDNNKLSIHFIGNGSTLIGSNCRSTINGYCSGALTRGNCNNGYSLYSGFGAIENIYNCLLLDAEGNADDFYGPLLAAKSLFNVVSETPGYMFAKTDELNLTNTLADNVYVQIYSWYFSQIYKLLSIEGGKIYCKSATIDGDYDTVMSGRGWTPNRGYNFGKEMPSFRLINKPFSGRSFYHLGSIFSNALEPLYLCNTTTFLCLQDVRIRSFTISGFHFCGSAGISVLPENDNDYSINTRYRNLQHANGVIDLIRVEGEMLRISDCSFRHNKGNILHTFKSKNVAFINNTCRDYHRHCVLVTACENVSILHNRLTNGNLRQNNEAGIVCDAINFHVAHNQIVDYGYVAIAVGRHVGWTFGEAPKPNGIVEYNEIILTSAYRSSLPCVPLMDGGAIYVWGWNSTADYLTSSSSPNSFGTVIRHNFISGHSGQYINPGIYCDEGTQNVTIYGNMVVGTRNSYSIFLKYKEGNGTCINNLMMLNIIDGCYFFQGTPGDQTTFKMTNIQLSSHTDGGAHNNTTGINSNNIKENISANNCHSHEWGISVPLDIAQTLEIKNNDVSSEDTNYLTQFIRGHLCTHSCPRPGL